MSEFINERFLDETLDRYTIADWQAFLEVVKQINQTKEFGQLIESKGQIFDYYEYANSIQNLEKIFYNMPLLVVFSWSAWEEGKQMYNNSSFDWDSVDLGIKCKIVTALIRSERFNEGTLMAGFEEGKIQRILNSMQNDIKKKFNLE